VKSEKYERLTQKESKIARKSRAELEKKKRHDSIKGKNKPMIILEFYKTDRRK
jgi:hypothetical protein